MRQPLYRLSNVYCLCCVGLDLAGISRVNVKREKVRLGFISVSDFLYKSRLSGFSIFLIILLLSLFYFVFLVIITIFYHLPLLICFKPSPDMMIKIRC